jgi:hypothetical protein
MPRRAAVKSQPSHASHEEIAERAFEVSQRPDRQGFSDDDNWSLAEQELRDERLGAMGTSSSDPGSGSV